MNDGNEFGKCDVCGKQEYLIRTVYRYPIKCECHSPSHFEIVRHGKDCKPKEPIYTKVEFKTDDLKDPIGMAMKVVTDALKEDKSEGSYYHSWQSNIACAIMDTMPEADNIHELANVSAKRFLDTLIG